jgi:hypothetical protein
MIDMYGQDADEVLAGNQAADLLASESTELPDVSSLEWSRYSPDFAIRDTKLKTLQVDNPTSYVQKRLYDQFLESHAHAYPAKSSYLVTPMRVDYDSNATGYIYRSMDPAVSAQQHVAIRIAAGKLKTKEYMHNQLLYELENKRNNRRYLEKRLQHLQQCYADDKCPFGCEVAEDLAHFLQCPRNADAWNALPQRVLAIINRYHEQDAFPEFPVWYYPVHLLVRHPTYAYEDEHATALELFSKQQGASGHIPSALRPLLLKLGCRNVDKCLAKIQVEILTALSATWRRRCKQIFE